jgi:RimJ/RimL family protein N-acetyltransferase
VVERSTGALAGWAGLAVPTFLPEVLPAVEVGWRLGEGFRGRGYATEAASAALRWGFTDLGLDTILSIFEPDNVVSGRVMDRLGFDAGFETTHPGRGLPIVVRSLAVTDWVPAGPS